MDCLQLSPYLRDEGCVSFVPKIAIFSVDCPSIRELKRSIGDTREIASDRSTCKNLTRWYGAKRINEEQKIILLATLHLDATYALGKCIKCKSRVMMCFWLQNRDRLILSMAQ